eukprot:TRINITY_DN95550_c0_g1_i2.p3 TRINITY_DN95550_c0_g1~~TRINITY_DN95550_c0_g1_i2.p3  ORF type:complete len:138 (+),score=29.86 TRINITY_DN95550_c0_g1_i2:188-601(+)
MSFSGGKLNLKGGGAGLKVVGGVKKKKKKKQKADSNLQTRYSDEGLESNDAGEEQLIAKFEDQEEIVFSDTNMQETTQDIQDRRTDYEKRRDEWMLRREEKLIQQAAKQSHRERIQDFNRRLDSLTEHYDIPKVGPG